MQKQKRSFLPLFLFVMCFFIIAALITNGIVFAKDDDLVIDNGIPVVYLRIDESRGSIDDMMTSPDHSVFCYGTLSIDVPEGFHYSDFPDLDCLSVEGLDMSIRGRGNFTWTKDGKRPFKIKLDKKANLFSLGKNKHWVLVANAMDPTLLRDRITAWLGDEMGFDFTPRGVPVDVVIVGEDFGTQYLGSYYFSENVRVDDNRLEIAELDADDTDPDVITGGYLIQNSTQVRLGSPDTFFTTRGANWATHTPSFDTEDDGYVNPAHQKYIQDYIQHFEDVLFENGTEYRELIDVPSAAKYWLINALSRNADAYATGSTYIYKDRDPVDGVSKIYWGPLWDFDYAYDHSSYFEEFDIEYVWLRPMFYDRGEGGFLEEVNKQWPVLRAAAMELIRDGGIIDQYYEETKASAEMDAQTHNPDEEFDYKANVETLKAWIQDRIKWIDANIDTLDNAVHKITYIVDGEKYRTDFMTTNSIVYGNERHPEFEDRTFLHWLDEDGNIIDSPTYIQSDRTFTAEYVSDDEITHGADIAFVKYSDVTLFNNYFPSYKIEYQVIPTDADNQDIVWTSSDPSIATVDKYGNVKYYSEGTVSFTGKLKHGAARTLTLTIVRDTFSFAQSISPEQAEIRLTVGQQSPCAIRTDPDPAKFSDCTYESDNPDVVTVGELGVLTAVGPGEAKVHISAKSFDENDERVTLTTEVKVIVTEPAPDEPTQPDKPDQPDTPDKPDKPGEPKKPCDGGDSCPSKVFTDVDRSKDSWYHEAVDWAYGNKVTDGMTDTTFAPDAACTRAQAVTFLWRANGNPDPKTKKNPFADVASDAYYYKAVLWAVENGITDGTTDTTFSPNNTCNRAHIVTFLFRSEHGTAGIGNPFLDVSAGKWYTEAVLWAVANGITDGVDETHFAPMSDCTRAHIVTFLYRDIAK